VSLRRRCDAPQNGGTAQPAVASDLQPVAAADRQRADRLLGRRVVDRELAVVQIQN
jgi:hypothetical protein